MTLEQLKNQLPDYAKDIKLNLSTLLNSETNPDLTSQQIYFIALASAYACKEPSVIQAIKTLAEQNLESTHLTAAKAAATIMAMNNIYYRFIHLASDKSFAAMPAKLRMNIIANPGIDKLSFELACLAVSAIHGCGLCMDSHTSELTKASVGPQAIQAAIKLAAVIHAATMSLIIEQSEQHN